MRAPDGASGQQPRRRRFYGWWMVGLCAVAHAMSAPGQTVGVSVFIDPMMETLALSRTEISTAYLIGTLTSAATMPRVGTLVDRFGSRRSMALVGGLFGVVLAAISGVGGLVTLAIGFTAIRLLGQGALSLVSTNAVAPWFLRRRGFAIGVSTAVGASLMSLLPIGSAAVIERIGWRSTWLVLAVVVWVVVLPIALRGVVDDPADLGQVPDGRAADGEQAARDEAWLARSYERREAMRTPAYWAIAAATLSMSTISTGLNFHLIDVLGEQGLSRIEAAANFLPQTVGTLLAALVVGALVDRLSHRWLIVGTMSMLAGAMLMVPVVRPGMLALLYGLLLGSSIGANRIVEAGATPKLYGLRNLGAIRGATQFVMVAGSSVGPLLISFGREMTGSYQAVLYWLLIAPIAVAVLAVLAPTPEPVPPNQRRASP